MSLAPAPAYRHSATSRLVRVDDWPRIPAGILLYKASMIVPDSRGFVYITHRGENPLLCLNPDGSLRNVIGQDVLKKSVYYYRATPESAPQRVEVAFCLHGLHLDPWENIWVTDFGRNLVMRFDPAGRLTLTLGIDGEAGCDETHFDQPTHSWVAPSGEIYVADGYINSRIVKFDRGGKFIKAWGSRGTEPGQFHTPHVLALGGDGRLYVSDRENGRIQIFNPEGEFLEMWSGFVCVDGLCLAPDVADLWLLRAGAFHSPIRPRRGFWTKSGRNFHPAPILTRKQGNVSRLRLIPTESASIGEGAVVHSRDQSRRQRQPSAQIPDREARIPEHPGRRRG